jgi:hypothetical protein
MKRLMAIFLGFFICNLIYCQVFTINDLITMYESDLDGMHDLCLRQDLIFLDVKYENQGTHTRYIFSNRSHATYKADPKERSTDVIKTVLSSNKEVMSITVNTDNQDLYLRLKEEVDAMGFRKVNTEAIHDDRAIITLYEGDTYKIEYTYTGTLPAQRFGIKLHLK